MKKITQISLLLALLVTFSGCFNNEPPKCSDEGVKQTLKDLYTRWTDPNSKEKLLVSALLPQTISEISSFRSVSYDKETKLRSCKASAKFQNGSEAAIEYTVQTNEEDSSQYYVELSADFLQSLIMNSAMSKFTNTQKDEPTPEAEIKNEKALPMVPELDGNVKWFNEENKQPN